MDTLTRLKNALPPTVAPPVMTAREGRATAVVVETSTDDLFEKGLRLAEQLRLNMRDLRNTSTKVNLNGADVLRSVDPAADGTSGALHTSMNEAKWIAFGIKRDLDTLKCCISDLKKNPTGIEDEHAKMVNDDFIQIQVNLLRYHTTQFVALMNEYNALMRRNEVGIRELAKRRIELKFTTDKGRTMSEEKLKELALEYPEECLPPLHKLGTTTDSTMEVCDRIAQSMQNLHQLYADLAAMVHEENAVKDQILENIEYFPSHNVEIICALPANRGGQRKRNCRPCWVIVLIAIFVVFVFAVILGVTL